MRILNATQMREADRRTIEEIGIPSLVLRENAGRQVVAAMEAMHPDLLDRQVAVLCGRGSNGGDGFVVARTLLPRAAMRALVSPRTPDTHKGDYGRVVVIAGSRGKTGAAHLAAVGALRSGAGLVTVATPASCLPIVAAMAPEYMTEALREADGGLAVDDVDRVLDMARDVIAIGPGLGQAPATKAFIT